MRMCVSADVMSGNMQMLSADVMGKSLICRCLGLVRLWYRVKVSIHSNICILPSCRSADLHVHILSAACYGCCI